MVKIAVWSDLHLEFQNTAPEFKNPGADVLILSGDVCVAEHLRRNPSAKKGDTFQKGSYGPNAVLFREFFKHVSNQFAHVVYVMGNHEHYYGRWDRTESILRNELAQYNNISLLEQQKLVIDNVVFLGTSLWTDLYNGNPLAIMQVKGSMNDYKHITEQRNGVYHKLSPLSTMYKHNESIQWLKTELAADNRTTVVVGHHAPSWRSIHESYANQQMTNSAYASSLENMILDYPHIAMWTHGHVHNCFDYMIGDTRILCNPHGYPGQNSEFDPTCMVELT